MFIGNNLEVKIKQVKEKVWLVEPLNVFLSSECFHAGKESASVNRSVIKATSDSLDTGWRHMRTSSLIVLSSFVGCRMDAEYVGINKPNDPEQWKPPLLKRRR